jgi:hypothetical protein
MTSADIPPLGRYFPIYRPMNRNEIRKTKGMAKGKNICSWGENKGKKGVRRGNIEVPVSLKGEK